MTFLSPKEVDERVALRGAEYRRREISEAVFAAYLFRMRFRGEDIRYKLLEYAPPLRAPSHEDERLAASRRYVEERTRR